MMNPEKPRTFQIDLPIYKPPPVHRVLWMRYRLQGRRFKLFLSKKGLLPAYLGENPRWRFFFRRLQPGFQTRRYTFRLARLVATHGPEHGLRAWKSLLDPRPPEEQQLTFQTEFSP